MTKVSRDRGVLDGAFIDERLIVAVDQSCESFVLAQIVQAGIFPHSLEIVEASGQGACKRVQASLDLWIERRAQESVHFARMISRRPGESFGRHIYRDKIARFQV